MPPSWPRRLGAAAGLEAGGRSRVQVSRFKPSASGPAQDAARAGSGRSKARPEPEWLSGAAQPVVFSLLAEDGEGAAAVPPAPPAGAVPAGTARARKKSRAGAGGALEETKEEGRAEAEKEPATAGRGAGAEGIRLEGGGVISVDAVLAACYARGAGAPARSVWGDIVHLFTVFVRGIDRRFMSSKYRGQALSEVAQLEREGAEARLRPKLGLMLRRLESNVKFTAVTADFLPRQEALIALTRSDHLADARAFLAGYHRPPPQSPLPPPSVISQQWNQSTMSVSSSLRRLDHSVAARAP